jgi:hypothetical protein
MDVAEAPFQVHRLAGSVVDRDRTCDNAGRCEIQGNSSRFSSHNRIRIVFDPGNGFVVNGNPHLVQAASESTLANDVDERFVVCRRRNRCLLRGAGRCSGEQRKQRDENQAAEVRHSPLLLVVLTNFSREIWHRRAPTVRCSRH